MRFVFVIILFYSAFVAKGQTPTFTFKCVCDYLTAADTNCDICTSTLQSRFFKGLLIYKNGVAHKWIEQPYTIIQNFDALTFRELIPGAEQIRIELLGTAFDSIEQFRDSVMCPCTATSTGTTLIAGPGINIWNDTIASIPQQVDTFDLVSGTADTIRLSLTRDSVPFHFVILPPDSDNQYIDTLRLTGTTLEISLFGDNQPLKTVDLSSLVADGDETIVTAGTGISVSGIGTAGNPYVITNTGDLSAANEGILGVSTGGANDALLTSNTSGANGVTYAGGSGITISESTSSNGGTITITNAGDLSTTNEIQTYGHSGTTTYTNTLSLGGGSFSITGAGINVVSQTAGAVTITGTEVDGSITNEGILGVGAGGATSSTLVSNTSGANAVTINAAGILSISESTSSNGGSITLTATEVDGSTTNELQTLANTSDATSHTVTLSNSGGSVKIVEGSGITIATTGTTLDGIATITATDASSTNEIQSISASGAGPTSYNIDLSLSGGSVTLSEGAGINLTRSGNDITIASTITDTDDQGLTIEGSGPTYDIAIDNGTDVTIAGGGIVTLSESPANTLIVTATEVDGSTSNELQSYGHSGTTSYTNTLSSGGGSFTLQSGTNVTLSHTAGITTISAASGADGNGIYGDGTPGSGDDALPAGGSNVSIPNDNSPLDVIVDASPGNPNPFLAIRVLTDYCADDAITKYFIGKSPSDSLSIENFDCGAILNEVGGTLTLQTDKELYVVGDSINLSTVQTRTVMPYLAGLTTSGWLQKIEGTSTGQILVWDEPNGWWEIGAPPGGGTITGSGTSDRVAYWTGSSSIASDNDFTFDGTDVGIGTTTLTARLNVNENTASASPFIANFYSASTSNGSAFIGIANTNNTGTSNVRLGESALGTYGASITRYGSGHSSRAKELNIGTFEPSAPVTFTMNTIVRMTISTDANVYVANKIYAGAGTAVTGAHSTVHSGGSFAGAFLETVGSPTFDDTKHVVVYTGSTNVSWTLPAASSCTGRYYWLHHANTSGTITLSSSISKGNGGNFSTITAGQWAFIVSTGSGWRGFKISSL